jgi:hypothetical protein
VPGEDAGYPGLDLFPKNEDDHAELLQWAQNAFRAADNARNDHYTKWQRWYGMRRSHIVRKEGDWRSKLFIPYAFSTIETIAPKLIAQVPGFIVNPVGPEDRIPAESVELMMNYCATNSKPDLYVELVKGYKSALTYGTGILKTYHQQVIKSTVKLVPQIREIPGPPAMVTDPMTGQVLRDPNGDPITQPTGSLGQMPTGQMIPQKQDFLIYEGPAAEWVDIFNFWPSPEAADVETARYVIHRTYKEMSEVMRRVEDGVYHWPPEMGPEDITTTTDEPMQVRQDVLGLGTTSDTTRKPVELLEFWTDDGRVVTMANRKAILRQVLNPFDHQEKPFVRVLDYLMEGEFWGVGEIEAIEGLQDLSNALVNQRIDNIRLLMNAMFAVNVEAVPDFRELESRPGGIVQVTGDRNPADAIHRLEFGDVTSSAFAETEQTERMIERTTGVTAYQTGQDSPSLNDTATGVGLIQEAGNTKFAMKQNLAEMMGLKALARQWGSLIQQFTTEQKWVRLFGPFGDLTFQSIQPDSIVGAMDFDIETASSTQTESVRKEQALTLLQVVSGIAPQAAPQLIEDVLKAFGKKDIVSYLGPEAIQRAMMLAQMQQAMSQGAPAQGQPQPGMQPALAPGPGQPGQPLTPQPPTDVVPQGPFPAQAPDLRTTLGLQ